jgi:hypothetical protein
VDERNILLQMRVTKTARQKIRRRQAISRAIGHVSTHITRCRQWEENGRKGRQPAFQPRCCSFPVLYKGNMFTWCSNGNAMVKLFNSREWLWYHIPFEPIDIEKRFPSEESWQRQNPMLVKKNKRWLLHFPFEKNVALRDKDFIRPVLAVDLGLTTTAVCWVVRSDGTVTHREFISYGGERDRLEDTLGRIAVKSAQTCLIPEGECFCGNQRRVVHHLTKEIAHQCSVKSCGRDFLTNLYRKGDLAVNNLAALGGRLCKSSLEGFE